MGGPRGGHPLARSRVARRIRSRVLIPYEVLRLHVKRLDKNNFHRTSFTQKRSREDRWEPEPAGAPPHAPGGPQRDGHGAPRAPPPLGSERGRALRSGGCCLREGALLPRLRGVGQPLPAARLRHQGCVGAQPELDDLRADRRQQERLQAPGAEGERGRGQVPVAVPHRGARVFRVAPWLRGASPWSAHLFTAQRVLTLQCPPPAARASALVRVRGGTVRGEAGVKLIARD